MNGERWTRNGERWTSAEATGRKIEPIRMSVERRRMSVERRRMLVERQQTEREWQADAKGTRSCQERYFTVTNRNRIRDIFWFCNRNRNLLKFIRLHFSKNKNKRRSVTVLSCYQSAHKGTVRYVKRCTKKLRELCKIPTHSFILAQNIFNVWFNLSFFILRFLQLAKI